MIKLIVAVALAAVSTLPAVAASKDEGAAAPSAAQSRQQSRMAACNKDAVGKKGDERKAFMKQCLSATAATPPAEPRKTRSASR